MNDPQVCDPTRLLYGNLWDVMRFVTKIQGKICFYPRFPLPVRVQFS